MYRQGDTAPCIANVKRRLAVFPVSNEFDDLLAQRLRGIQTVHGMRADGVLNVETADAAGVLGLLEERSWAVTR